MGGRSGKCRSSLPGPGLTLRRSHGGGEDRPRMRNSVSMLYSRPLCSYPVCPSQGENGQSGWQILEQRAELAREGDCRVWLEGQDTNELSFLHLLRVPRDRSHRLALSLAAWSLPLLRVSLSQTREQSPLRPRYCSRQPLPAFQFLCLPLCLSGVPFPPAVGALSIPLCSLRP